MIKGLGTLAIGPSPVTKKNNRNGISLGRVGRGGGGGVTCGFVTAPSGVTVETSHKDNSLSLVH